MSNIINTGNKDNTIAKMDTMNDHNRNNQSYCNMSNQLKNNRQKKRRRRCMKTDAMSSQDKYHTTEIMPNQNYQHDNYNYFNNEDMINCNVIQTLSNKIDSVANSMNNTNQQLANVHSDKIHVLLNKTSSNITEPIMSSIKLIQNNIDLLKKSIDSMAKKNIPSNKSKDNIISSQCATKSNNKNPSNLTVNIGLTSGDKVTVPPPPRDLLDGILNCLKKIDCEECNNDGTDDVFKEIQIPDMKRDIFKQMNKNTLDNFEELILNTLDDILVCGEKFIDAIKKHNKEVDEIDRNKTSNTTQNIIDVVDEVKTSENLACESKTKKLKSFPDVKIYKKITTSKKRTPPMKHIFINDEIKKDSDNLYAFIGKRYSVNPRKMMKLVKPIKILNSMIGMSEIKSCLYKFISNFLYTANNNGMLNTAIYGKPGIGKTDLGKILCMIYSALEIVQSAKFRLVRASDLIGSYVGQTRQKTKTVLDEAGGGVLFIDEAYALVSGSSEKISYGKECIDTINQELSENRKKLVVIIAGYESEIKEGFFRINQGLERRFPFRYVLKDYTKEEMKDIFLRMIRLNEDVYLYKDENDTNDNTKTITDKDIIALFEDMRYFNNCGGDIENLITQINFANSGRTLGKYPSNKNIYTKDDLKQGLEMFKKNKTITETENDTWRKMFS